MVDVSGFAYSRLKKLSGVSIEVTLDPTKLTPRIRKAAQKLDGPASIRPNMELLVYTI